MWGSIYRSPPLFCHAERIVSGSGKLKALPSSAVEQRAIVGHLYVEKEKGDTRRGGELSPTAETQKDKKRNQKEKKREASVRGVGREGKWLFTSSRGRWTRNPPDRKSGFNAIQWNKTTSHHSYHHEKRRVDHGNVKTEKGQEPERRKQTRDRKGS